MTQTLEHRLTAPQDYRSDTIQDYATDVGCTAMYFGSLGSGRPFGGSSMGPSRSASMGSISPMRGPSIGVGGGYGPVSRMDLDPFVTRMREAPREFVYKPLYTPEPEKETFDCYNLGYTQLHVHKSGIGTIKIPDEKKPVFTLDRYRTAMAEYDLQNEIPKLLRYCNKEDNR